MTNEDFKGWAFKVFVDQNGVSDFYEWRRTEMSPEARARMRLIISHMEITKDWTNMPYFEPLTGYRGICEIKIKVNNVQYRPLGCYIPHERSFVILTGAKEKGDKLTPKSAPWTAVKRRQMILEDRRYIGEYH